MLIELDRQHRGTRGPLDCRQRGLLESSKTHGLRVHLLEPDPGRQEHTDSVREFTRQRSP